MVTSCFRMAEIPLEDVTLWLSQRCKVLLGVQHMWDHTGYRNGGSRAIVVLERDPGSGWIWHLPKYVFMGADWGVVHYAGHLPTCYQCGEHDHIHAHCTTELCSKCGVRGHCTATCRWLPTCSLCRQVNHAYLYCPESAANRSDPEAFKREKAHMWEAEQRWRESERAWEESHQANLRAVAEEAARWEEGERGGRSCGSRCRSSRKWAGPRGQREAGTGRHQGGAGDVATERLAGGREEGARRAGARAGEAEAAATATPTTAREKRDWRRGGGGRRR